MSDDETRLAELKLLAPISYQLEVPAKHPSWQRLAEAYSAPPRAYHNLGHVVAVARAFGRIKSQLQRQAEVYAAVLFHDAIYEVGSEHAESNEVRSAHLCHELLSGALSPQGVDHACDLIRATQYHLKLRGTATGDLAYFLDCDLSILGADESGYQRYLDGIREEYSYLPPGAFDLGRMAWLRGMLGKTRDGESHPGQADGEPRIFSTEAFENGLGERARANLRHELAQYERAGGGPM
ncbi:MAG: hypothetical protein H6718_27170 [Polyangiaceae bacterium]|nr:hypothetical protein [Myxococcales bacterium]MCB9589125.1 hypothetical protein [Polyangiaceae bacterium]